VETERKKKARAALRIIMEHREGSQSAQVHLRDHEATQDIDRSPVEIVYKDRGRPSL
jgi:hypothetical protein